jgi:hypothetical protein
MKTNPPKRLSGRKVAFTLILVCGAGFLATIWNYSRTHPFATDATVVSPTTVEAMFSKNLNLKKGQRAVVSIPGMEIRGGTILEISDTGRALIQMDSDIGADTGTKALVNIDGTVGPQPAK